MNQRRDALRRSRKGGFTLLEMMIVIALIVLILGLSIANFDKIFGENQVQATKMFVTSQSELPLTTYRIHVGNYPSTTQGLQALITAPEGASARWKGPYVKPGTTFVDPWGNPYQYRFPGTKNPTSYDLYSFGPDGVESADDIGNW